MTAERTLHAPVATPSQAWREISALGFLALAGLVYAVMQSFVAPALPAIAHDLGASTADASWVLTAYLLAASVATPIVGRLGDMFGKRRMLLVVLCVLCVGTVIAALAGNLAVLLIGRVMQGAAGSVLPLSIGLVRDQLPPERVGVAIGMLSSIFGIGGAAGIVLAGPIIDHLSWHWLFWFPLLLAALAFTGIAFGIRESPVRNPGRVDILGAALLSAGLVCLLLALSKGGAWGWTSTPTIGLFGGAALTLVVWVVVERRIAEPLIDMAMMTHRGVWTTNLVGLAFGFAMFSSFLLTPQLLQLSAATGYGFGLTVSQAGLFLLPSAVGMLVCGPISGALNRRFGAKLPLTLGAVIATASFALPAIAHDKAWQMLTSSALLGIGIGLAFAAMANAIVAAVAPTQTGVATSVNTITRTIGGSIGTATLAATLTASAGTGHLPTDDGFTHSFWTSAGVLGLGLLAALLVPARGDATTPSERHGPAASARSQEHRLT